MNGIVVLKIAENTLRETGRQEFAVTCHESLPVGIVELFNYDRVDQRAEVAVFIEASHRAKGYGKAALEELIGYCRDVLQLHQLVCDVAVDNTASRHLFESLGFAQCGLLKEWTATPYGWSDALRMQKIL